VSWSPKLGQVTKTGSAPKIEREKGAGQSEAKMEFVPFLFLGATITGAIWMAVKAFKDSIKAGLAWVFIPFYFIVYLSNHWGEMKKPFYIWLVGIVGYSLGIVFLWWM